MIITKFIILDYEDKEGGIFEFSDKGNIITSDKNTAGKSCLLKSLYFTLGMGIKTFNDTWEKNNMYFKLYYIHNEVSGYIVRNKNRFYVNNIKQSLNEKEYAKWLCELLDIKLKLALNLKDKEENKIEDVYASAVLLPFYIDQDNSWSKTPYKNTTNLSMYKPEHIPAGILEYYLGISDDKIIEFQDKKAEVTTKRNKNQRQHDVLTELSDKFQVDVQTLSTFDEDKAKDLIEEYLKLANNINKKIQDYKNNLYKKYIELDNISLEFLELSAILEELNSNYKKIEGHTCPTCNSKLTQEQAIYRIKLDTNIFEINNKREELKGRIEKIEKNIQNFKTESVGMESEYKKLLNIAETKQNEISLKQHINIKTRAELKEEYIKVKNQLILEIEKLEHEIKEIDSQIAAIKKHFKEKRDTIERDYDENISILNIRFQNSSIKNYKFLSFKEISATGNLATQTFIGIYMAYTKLLFKYSKVILPFVLDNAIHQDPDENNRELIFKTIDEYLLQSNKQVFIAIRNEHLKYISEIGQYNMISFNNETRILSKEKYSETLNEFNEIFI